jgi:hypothetical protein
MNLKIMKKNKIILKETNINKFNHQICKNLNIRKCKIK